MFEVTVKGKYVISGKLAQIDEYEEVFEMAEGREAYARAIIQNSGILDERLSKIKKNYKRWQTCAIVGIKEVKGEKENKNIDPELEELFGVAVDLACVPVNYKRLVKNQSKKDALKEAIEKKEVKILKAMSKKGSLKKKEAA